MTAWVYAATRFEQYRVKTAINLLNGVFRVLLAVVVVTQYIDVATFLNQSMLTLADAANMKPADLMEYMIKMGTLPFVVAGSACSALLDVRQYVEEKQKRAAKTV